jgi:putative tryptophan/tyrosine transport system substrate-binding protein
VTAPGPVVIVSLILALLAAPLAAEAQQTGHAFRVGFLSTASASSAAPRVEAFTRGLRELGYIEGQTITIEYRWAEGRDERLPALAADLVRLKVDVVVTQGTVPTLAARHASPTMPIVMAAAGDPVATGLVASLARPGGTITGLTQVNPEVAGKRLELLQAILPGQTRVAVLWNPGNPVAGPELRETEDAARSLGLQLQTAGVRDPQGFERAIVLSHEGRAHAIVLLSDIMFVGQRRHIVDLAAVHRLPIIAWTREFAAAGALMTYGPNTIEMHRRAATYVDKILKGAKPADLPVEQPTKFELVVNLKTAKALGLTIPSAVLARADDIIQ